MNTQGKDCGYISVYLLDSIYAIDTSYDYFVPLGMRDNVTRGMFVIVPFGKGNRKLLGVVWEVKSMSTYANPKTIISFCRDRQPLSEEMLGLCTYMKNHLLCTMGDIIRCVVPPSALGKLEEYYSPTKIALPNTSDMFTSADLFVYDYICTKGLVSADTLKGKFGAVQTEACVKKLLEKEIIERTYESKTAGGLYETYYSLTDAEISGVKLSEKQKTVINLLSVKGEMTLPEICESTGVTASPVKTLTDKGIIQKRQERKFRGFDFEGLPEPVKYVLNDEQKSAVGIIKEHLHSNQPRAVLLHGVTGSGKTSVIVTSIDEAISLGRGVIVLLPEIALTPQTLNIFRARYGERVCLVHSGLSAGERYDAYTKILSGDADIVIGTRSAIFSPVKNLGLVVIDEEHETTYKSETSPKYHARDIARWRCAYNRGVMLLSSATPSLESYKKALDGKYQLIKLTQRYGEAILPSVKICDMRREPRQGNLSPLGRELKEELRGVLARGEQAVLFLNRRGYNTTVCCPSCGDAITCPHCSVTMSYHAPGGNHDRGFLFCHWCGQKINMPKGCPSCGGEHLSRVGFGTQKIEKELCELYPEARVLRMDADSTSGKNNTREITESFRRGEADILIGTQMVTKGHDFPNVTLVGVLLADMSLYADDFHANEKTFSMLTQVIGRAGRSDKNGIAIIQTNNPENDTIKYACEQNYEGFYNSEIRLRKLLTFPPYCDIAVINVISPNEIAAVRIAGQINEEIDKLVENYYPDVPLEIFGPFEAPVYKVDEKFRMRTVVKCKLNDRCRRLFGQIMKDFCNDKREKTTVGVDFNPTGL